MNWGTSMVPLHPVDEIESFNKDKNKTYYVHCKSGNRSAKASKYLAEQGYDVVNLDGGYKAYEEKTSAMIQKKKKNIKCKTSSVNYSGLQCPGPIVNISKEVKIFKKVTKLRLQSQIQDSQVILKAGQNKRDTLVKLDGVTMKLNDYSKRTTQRFRSESYV